MMLQQQQNDQIYMNNDGSMPVDQQPQYQQMDHYERVNQDQDYDEGEEQEDDEIQGQLGQYMAQQDDEEEQQEPEIVGEEMEMEEEE